MAYLKISVLLCSFLFLSLGQAQSSLEGFATGRYETHPTTAQATKTKARQPSSEAAPTSLPVKKPVKVLPVEPLVEKPVEKPTTVVTAETLAEEPKTVRVQEPFAERAADDDIRKNRMEIEFSPTAVYNDSLSDYSYRDYSSYFSALKLQANVWFTPQLGISGQMLFSLGADLGSNDGTSDRVQSKYENLDLGLNYRQFFGASATAKSLQTSLLFSENKLSTPSDNSSRMKLKTTGLGLGLKARIPTSKTYSWVFGGRFFPRLQHSEEEVALDASSGSSTEHSRLGLDVGGEIRFSRGSQVIWNLSLDAERNLFDGAAHSPDPRTGVAPSNVSVTNSFYMFSLGYRWGH